MSSDKFVSRDPFEPLAICLRNCHKSCSISSKMIVCIMESHTRRIVMKPENPVDQNRSEKEKSLALAVQNIEKQFGKGSIMRLGNEERMTNEVDVTSTGSLGIDIA